MSGKLRYIVPFVILAVSLLGAIIIVASKPDVTPKSPEVKPRLIRVLQVEPRDVRMTLQSQGTVKPRTESALVSQVAGLIESIAPSFVAGGFFEKGDMLVQLDASDYEFAMTQAKQLVAQAQLVFQLEEQQGKLARDEWQRLNESPAPKLVAREPQLAQAKAALESAKASLQQAELNLERTRIRAPFAGRIRLKNADVGQYVTPGMVLAQVYAIDYAEVRLPLPDDQLAYLDMAFDFRDGRSSEQGPEVVLTADFAGQQQTWIGYLERIEAEVDNRSRMIHVVARVENPYGKKGQEAKAPLAVGLFVQAAIQGKLYKNIFAIPREAMLSNHHLLVVGDQNKLFRRQAKVLRYDSQKAYISSGLAPGELVCLSNLDAFVEGMLVEPVLAEQGEE